MANIDRVTEKWNEGIHEDAAQVAEKAGDMVNQLKEKVSQLGHAATEKVDEGRASTAQAIQGSAASLRSAGQSSSDALTNAADATAGKLESTALYIREHDFTGMMKDLEHVVRRNPSRSIATAIVFGFVAGVAFRNRS